MISILDTRVTRVWPAAAGGATAEVSLGKIKAEDGKVAAWLVRRAAEHRVPVASMSLDRAPVGALRLVDDDRVALDVRDRPVAKMARLGVMRAACFRVEDAQMDAADRLLSGEILSAALMDVPASLDDTQLRLPAKLAVLDRGLVEILARRARSGDDAALVKLVKYAGADAALDLLKGAAR